MTFDVSFYHNVSIYVFLTFVFFVWGGKEVQSNVLRPTAWEKIPGINILSSNKNILIFLVADKKSMFILFFGFIEVFFSSLFSLLKNSNLGTSLFQSDYIRYVALIDVIRSKNDKNPIIFKAYCEYQYRKNVQVETAVQAWVFYFVYLEIVCKHCATLTTLVT